MKDLTFAANRDTDRRRCRDARPRESRRCAAGAGTPGIDSMPLSPALSSAAPRSVRPKRGRSTFTSRPASTESRRTFRPAPGRLRWAAPGARIGAVGLSAAAPIRAVRGRPRHTAFVSPVCTYPLTFMHVLSHRFASTMQVSTHLHAGFISPACRSSLTFLHGNPRRCSFCAPSSLFNVF